MEQGLLRPREKLASAGAGALSVVELLQILIGSGVGSFSSARIARHVKECVAQCPEGILQYKELIALPGIGPAKACTLLAAFELGKRMAPPC